MTDPVKPMEYADLAEDRRWSQASPIYANGYHDAKDGHYRNDYPAGSLRWHAYERGWLTADNYFNRQPDNRETTTTTGL